MDACIEWEGARLPKGYGFFTVVAGTRGKHSIYAHRLAYELLVGPIPPGFCIDHLCRNPSCVNPAHLEAVTHAENVRRGLAGAVQRAKTHCPHGHAYDEENTYINARGFRFCRACRRIAVNRWYARRKAEVTCRTGA